MATDRAERTNASEKEVSSPKEQDSSNKIAQKKSDTQSSEDLNQKTTEPFQNFNFQDFIFSPFTRESRSEVWALHVLDGPNNGAQSFLESDRDYWIGRDSATCDIVLLDPRISKKHLLISIKKDNQAFVKDLSSTNGTTSNGKPLNKEEKIDGSIVLGLGSSSILIVNTQVPQKTVILPSEEELKEILQRSTGEYLTSSNLLGLKKFKYILIGIAVGTILLLFSLIPNRQVTFDRAAIDPAQLEKILSNQTFLYEFSEESREVILSGHIHKENERFKILSQLSELPFVETINSQRLIIDELLCREFNIVLIPQWPGISLNCPRAGEYFVEGFVETKALYEELQLYLQLNFPLINHLKNLVIVEEESLEVLNLSLEELAPNRLAAELIEGELIVAGTIFEEEEIEIDKFIKFFQERSRYKTVRKGLVNQRSKKGLDLSKEEKFDSLNLSQDISAQYPVSGYVKKDGQYQVYLKGKLYRTGDVLDGMKILSIEKRLIMLENEIGLFKISFFSR